MVIFLNQISIRNETTLLRLPTTVLPGHKQRSWLRRQAQNDERGKKYFWLFMLLASLACTIRGATAGKRRKHCFDVDPKTELKNRYKFSVEKKSQSILGQKEHLLNAVCAQNDNVGDLLKEKD